MPETKIEAQLRNAERSYRATALKAELLRSRRNALIREARSRGLTHARIAELTGLSRGRISQL